MLKACHKSDTASVARGTAVKCLLISGVRVLARVSTLIFYIDMNEIRYCGVR